jgi:hypothetical protein
MDRSISDLINNCQTRRARWRLRQRRASLRDLRGKLGVALVVSAPITIIWPVPSIGRCLRTDLRLTNLTRGDATLLSSQAGDPRAAAGDATHGGQTLGRHRAYESARRRPENQPTRSDACRRPWADCDSEPESRWDWRNPRARGLRRSPPGYRSGSRRYLLCPRALPLPLPGGGVGEEGTATDGAALASGEPEEDFDEASTPRSLAWLAAAGE